MIDFNEKDIVIVRRTADDQRFALFTKTDVQPFWAQRFWGVVLDTGADGFGTPVRYGSACTAPTGWTICQLICVVQARMVAEHERAPEAGALAVLKALDRATRQMPEGNVLGHGVTLEPGGQASPYRWTIARCDDLTLPLCPDPESQQEGITPELVLILLDQMLQEWTERAPYLRRLWTCRNAIRDALAEEVHRVRTARGKSQQAV